MLDRYRLDGKQTVKCESLAEWSEWFNKNSNSHVALTYVGKVIISTVFLGIDHSFDSGPPKLFETMVFGGALDGAQERCSTWKQAEAQHAAMLARVKGELPV